MVKPHVSDESMGSLSVVRMSVAARRLPESKKGMGTALQCEVITMSPSFPRHCQSLLLPEDGVRVLE